MAEIVSSLVQWTSLEWVAEQATNGNAIPFVTWTLLVGVIGFFAGSRYERKRSGHVSKRKIARGFSGDVKAAARDALEADGMVPIGRYEAALLSLSRAHPGVFEFSDPMGHVGSGSTYQLSPVWRDYLKRHDRYLE